MQTLYFYYAGIYLTQGNVQGAIQNLSTSQRTLYVTQSDKKGLIAFPNLQLSVSIASY